MSWGHLRLCLAQSQGRRLLASLCSERGLDVPGLYGKPRLFTSEFQQQRNHYSPSVTADWNTREMYEQPRFPQSRQMRGGYVVTADILKPEAMPKVRQLFMDYEGKGAVGLDEGLADRILENPFDSSRNAFQFTDSVTGEFLGALFYYPCWTCRSCKPVLANSYAIITPAAQGKGIGRYMVHLRDSDAWCKGYIGFGARAVVSSLGHLSSLAVGELTTGVIPLSCLTSDGKRLDDCVVTNNYDASPTLFQKRLQEINNERDVQPPPPDGVSPTPSFVYDAVDVSPKTFTLNDGEQTQIKAAQLDDIPHLEAHIRQAASAGRGFALDEFQSGYFNRKFLRQSHTIVAKNQTNAVIAGAIFGRSYLCRSVTAPLLSVYLIVSADYHRRGLGSALLCAVEEYAKKEKMTGLLIDTFVTDTNAIDFLIRHGFVRVCTLPKYGHIKGHGITDSFLWYKQLKNQSNL